MIGSSLMEAGSSSLLSKGIDISKIKPIVGTLASGGGSGSDLASFADKDFSGIVGSFAVRASQSVIRFKSFFL